MLTVVTRVILILSSIYVVAKGEWFNVWALGSALLLTFVPYLMQRFLKIKLTRDIINFSMLFIVLSQWLGTYLRAYDWLPWWDVFLHGLSGVLISLGGILLILLGDKKGILFKQKMYGLITVIMFLTGAASAVFWEIFEYTGDSYFGTFAQLGSLVDTMEDMIICVIVSAVFCLVVYMGLKKGSGGYFVRQVESLVALNEGHKEKAVAK